MFFRTGTNLVILLKKYIKDLLIDGSVFVSIGANDGIFVDEIFQSNLLKPSWKSFFIEPVTDTFNKLVSNYNKHYPNNNFIFVNAAINTYNGEGFLITNKVDDSMGMCSFFRHESDSTIKIPVNCITFAEFIDRYEIKNIDFLKIDTEGMDYEIVVQCLNNNIKPKLILLEHIELANNNNTVSSYNDMINLTSPYYDVVRDTPEYQYEESNLLLIDKNYV